MASIPLTFPIHPSHPRARLDATGQRVLCGYRNDRGDYVCSGHVADRWVGRQLLRRPGWGQRADGVLIAPKHQQDRIDRGRTERQRCAYRYWSSDAAKPGIPRPALQAIHRQAPIWDFRAVAVCPRCGQYNVLEADLLDALTREEYEKAGEATPEDETIVSRA